MAAGALAAHAVQHSRSGTPGGRFSVHAEVTTGRPVRLGVEDQGGPWRRPCLPLQLALSRNAARGLLIVDVCPLE